MNSEQENKSKIYAETRRGDTYSQVFQGNQVLVQQQKRDKLSTQFKPNLYTVLSNNGNSLVVQPREGAQYSFTHVKKLLRNSDTPSAQEERVRTMPPAFFFLVTEKSSTAPDILVVDISIIPDCFIPSDPHGDCHF